MGAVVQFPNSARIDIVPFAEEDGPFGVVLYRGSPDDEATILGCEVIALGLGMRQAGYAALDAAGARNVPLAPQVLELCPDLARDALDRFYDGGAA